MIFLRTFGGLSLENGGRPLLGAAAQRRPLAILAVVAASGPKGLSRERLQLLFWPNSETERARGALKQALYSLRRDLSEQDLTLGANELRLNDSLIQSDVGRFERELDAGNLEAAVKEYSGPYLDGVHFRKLGEFERWAERERDRLAGRYRSVIEELAKGYASRNELASAARLWGKLAAEDPYASRIAIAYMKALAGAGEREAAIKHADIHSRLVKEELEAEPEPEIARLVSELRGRANGTGRPSGTSPVVVTPLPGDETSQSQSDSFPPIAEKPSEGRRIGLKAVVVGSLALLGIAALFITNRSRSQPLAPANARVVVIPFENRTGDPTLDALGSMGADWIADGLARAELLPVVDPATAAAAFRRVARDGVNGKGSSQRIAEITGATSVVSGSFYRRGDSLEFQTRLSDGKTGDILGSIDPVTVPAATPTGGLGVLRQKTLSLLAHSIDSRLSQVVAPGADPPNFEAYRKFVAGVDQWARTQSPDGSGTPESDPIPARTAFRKAYELDTTFASALVWALFTYPELTDPVAKGLLDSLTARKDRLAPLDRHAVEYFQARLRGDNSAAITAAKAASDLAPRSEWSWNAGQLIFPLNRPREALKHFERLDPENGWMRQGWEYYWYLTAQTMHMLGDLKGTRVWLEKARRKFPENVSIAAAYARALALTGTPDSATAIVREILQSDSDWRVFYVYSILADLQRHGRKREVTAVLDQVLPWYRAKAERATESDRRDIGSIFFELRMLDSAESQFKELKIDFPTSTWRTMYGGRLAVLRAIRGDSTTALALIRSIPKGIQQWPGENIYWHSRVSAELGHKAEAVAQLAKAFEEGYPQISLSHSTWYDFPTLQGYPPFEALVASDR